jgi:hypothetical protein
MRSMSLEKDEVIQLGSRQNVLIQLAIWLVITGFIGNAVPRLSGRGYQWIAFLLAFWIGLTFVVSQFTFGEANENELRYWRIWGWQRVRWKEVEKIEDQFRVSGIVVIPCCFDRRQSTSRPNWLIL